MLFLEGGMSYHLVNPEDRVEINQRQCKKWPPQITLFYYSLTHSSFDFKTKVGTLGTNPTVIMA